MEHLLNQIKLLGFCGFKTFLSLTAFDKSADGSSRLKSALANERVENSWGNDDLMKGFLILHLEAVSLCLSVLPPSATFRIKVFVHRNGCSSRELHHLNAFQPTWPQTAIMHAHGHMTAVSPDCERFKVIMSSSVLFVDGRLSVVTNGCCSFLTLPDQPQMLDLHRESPSFPPLVAQTPFFL